MRETDIKRTYTCKHFCLKLKREPFVRVTCFFPKKYQLFNVLRMKQLNRWQLTKICNKLSDNYNDTASNGAPPRPRRTKRQQYY